MAKLLVPAVQGPFPFQLNVGNYSRVEEVLPTGEVHVPQPALLVQASVEIGQVQPLLVCPQDAPEVVEIPRPVARPSPALQARHLLQDRPQFLGENLLKGVGQYLNLQTLSVLVHDLAPHRGPQDRFVNRDLDFNWGIQSRCQGSRARI